MFFLRLAILLMAIFFFKRGSTGSFAIIVHHFRAEKTHISILTSPDHHHAIYQRHESNSKYTKQNTNLKFIPTRATHSDLLMANYTCYYDNSYHRPTGGFFIQHSYSARSSPDHLISPAQQLKSYTIKAANRCN